MIVCLCRRVTESEIEDHARAGARTIVQLQEKISVCDNCRVCESFVQDVLNTVAGECDGSTLGS